MVSPITGLQEISGTPATVGMSEKAETTATALAPTLTAGKQATSGHQQKTVTVRILGTIRTPVLKEGKQITARTPATIPATEKMDPTVMTPERPWTLAKMGKTSNSMHGGRLNAARKTVIAWTKAAAGTT